MNNLKELLAAADNVTSTLAAYDLEVRELDLPGIPDKVWEELSTICGALSRALEDEDLKYDELDFTEYYPNYDEEEPDDETEDEPQEWPSSTRSH